MARAKQCPIQCSLSTYEQCKYLALISGKQKSQLLREVFEALFLIGATFDRANFDIEASALNSSVTFTFHGKNRASLGLGSIPSSKLSEVYRAFGYVDGKDTTEKPQKKEVEKQ